MHIINIVIDYILHLDEYLGSIISAYGAVTYLLLFIVVFCETGLVVTPFLPGDSLIFAAAAFAAVGSLNLAILFFIFAFAAILGDAVNYLIGKKLGQAFIDKKNHKFLKKESIDRTIAFFDKHGGKTIAIARFIPVIRTFAPFVAGAGQMKYRRFLSFNAIGGTIWVILFLSLGYFFGNLQVVKDHFSFIIIAIIIISLPPPLNMK
ncbi:MAG: VTT domain-containing protein [Clostridiales bacterium]|jgi:membrane-associated protein|nr:VTT domain-containing protein [Clostridiales bacterium]